MEELWKLATDFIGDDLLDTKAYLMYHGKILIIYLSYIDIFIIMVF